MRAFVCVRRAICVCWQVREIWQANSFAWHKWSSDFRRTTKEQKQFTGACHVPSRVRWVIRFVHTWIIRTCL